MILMQMTIHSYGKRVTVFVTESSADRGDINTGFNAGNSEVVAKIVMGELWAG